MLKQRAALNKAVEALQRSGALTDSDAAEIAAAESLADVIDAAQYFDADLWREYRLAIKALREARPDDADNDEIGKLVEALRSSAPMGDPAH